MPCFHEVQTPPLPRENEASRVRTPEKRRNCSTAWGLADHKQRAVTYRDGTDDPIRGFFTSLNVTVHMVIHRFKQKVSFFLRFKKTHKDGNSRRRSLQNKSCKNLESGTQRHSQAWKHVKEILLLICKTDWKSGTMKQGDTKANSLKQIIPRHC